MPWIYSLPTWLLEVGTLLTVALVVGSALCLFRRSPFHHGEITHNDVAGPIVNTAGTILAVLLSFMVVTVWQQYDHAATTVQHEASAVGDLFDLAASLPSQQGTTLRDQLADYVHVVITREWPEMQRDRFSLAAHNDLVRIAATLYHFHPTTPGLRELRNLGVSLEQRVYDARRSRIYQNSQGIPPLMWITMLIVAFVTVGHVFLFRVHSESVHVTLAVSLAVIVTVICLLIAELDFPFRGDISVSPAAFVRIQTMMARDANLMK